MQKDFEHEINEEVRPTYSVATKPKKPRGRLRSRPKRELCSYTPDDIIDALRGGKTLKQLGEADRGFPYSSRLAVRMTESGSDAYFESRETIRRRTNPVDDAEVDAAFRTIERCWKLCTYHPKTGRWRHRYLIENGKKETPKQFKARVLKIIDAEYATFIKLADITKDHPMAPHSDAEFMKDTDRTKRTVSTCITSLVAKGYILQIPREKGRSPLYIRPASTENDLAHEAVIDRYVHGLRSDRPETLENHHPSVQHLDSYRQAADIMVQARLDRHNRGASPADLSGWVKYIARLAKELGRSSSPVPPAIRILKVARWYEQNWREIGKFMPIVENGSSLYKKFSTVEAMMLDRTRQSVVPTVAEVVADLFNGSRVMAEAFETDILDRARGIDFGRVSEPELASALAAAYREVRAARRGVNPSDLTGMPGPLDVLRRYVDWLGNKLDWKMTTRVLSTSSPAFQQWRRDEAALHPRGVDPLIGRG